MVSNFVLLILAVALMAPKPSLAGGVVSNGGDAVYCREGSVTEDEGYYALDYIVSRVNGHASPDFAVTRNWKTSADRILGILEIASPALAKKFLGFYQTTQSIFIFPGKGRWTASLEELPRIMDQGVIPPLPRACKKSLEIPDELSIIQTVVRQASLTPFLFYKYNAKVFMGLSQNSLQLSMIFVHEWIWSLTDDVQKLRKLNEFLHLKSTESLSAQEIKLFIEDLGIIVP